VIQPFGTLIRMAPAPCAEFGPAALRGLAEIGRVDIGSGDLSVELGLSVWLQWSGSSHDEARTTLLALREQILSACALDRASEPTPMVGRSAKLDLVMLAGYLGDLLRRAAHTARCTPAELARQVIASLPSTDTALGA
jgi:hypothetical protein